MDCNTYTALTLGPIIKTLSLARKTREVWAASYFFSYLMKAIMTRLIEKKGVEYENIIIPNLDREIVNSKNGSGLFPDRLIIKGGVIEALSNTVDAQVKEISKKIACHIDREENKVYEFCKRYLKFYIVEIELEGNENIIHSTNKYLDYAELRESFVPREKENYLKMFFTHVNRMFNNRPSFLLEDGFGDKITRFPSVSEIATIDLKSYIKDTNFPRISVDDNDDNLYRELKNILLENKLDFKVRYKYMAIIQADGDGIGGLIRHLGNKPEDIKRFSKTLASFSREASQCIIEYGGYPVYLGGDDILAFIPLYNKNKTCFDLIFKLDEKFKKCFECFENNPTLSYGLSISYYKYPLAEAMEQARDLLFQKAKRITGKNAIAFNLLKHSGQTYNAVIPKDGESFDHFTRLLNNNINDSRFLTGVIKKLNGLLLLLLESNIERMNNRIKLDDCVDNLLRNFFDKAEHRENREFLESVKSLVVKIYTNNRILDKKSSINAMLHLVKFFNDKDDK